MIWSFKTRLIHWLIALPVLVNFILEGGETPHQVLGYVAFGAMLVRIVWGFIAKDQARFSAFPFAEVFKARRDYPGHNPQASWVYVFIWLLVGGLGVTGFMMGLDAFWGEEWLEDLHENLSNTLLVLVGLHLLGIAFDAWKYRRKTWLGMITGRRQ
jgi:cytochrome b